MSTKISIYLAGSIKKGHEREDELFWTDADMVFLRRALPEYEISFLNPAFRSDDLSDQRSVFGRDMTQVFCSDVVFVDARNRRGLGVGVEMMWAKFHKIPIFTLAPTDSHYNKSKTTLLDVAVENWVHPFVESLSDAIVENLSDGADWVRKFVSTSTLKVTARMLKVLPRTVIGWVSKFRKNRIDGLKEQGGRGRKRSLEKDDEKVIGAMVEEMQSKREGGRIRGQDVHEMIKNCYGLNLSNGSLYRVLHRAGLSWITGRSQHPKADPKKQENFKKTLKKEFEK
jgi:transposase